MEKLLQQRTSLQYAFAGLVVLVMLCTFGTVPRALISKGHGRSLQQLAPSVQNGSNNYLVLAGNRTARRDPLNHFKIYHNGWNIRDKHYWASVGYTACPGFVLAVIWLLIGLGCGLLTCSSSCCCCRDKLHGKHRRRNIFTFLLLIFFTAAAVTGCILVYIGQGRSHDEFSNTLEYVVDESELVVNRLYNVSLALSMAQNLTVLRFDLPTSDRSQIALLKIKIDTAAKSLQNQTTENANRISSGLNNVRLAMVVVVGVMLLLGLLGFLLAFLVVPLLVYLLVFLGWFLVAGTWVLCGLYIMLNNTVGDTCIAMEEWVANPSATTNLKDIIPCVDASTTNQTLLQTRDAANDTVAIINTAISQSINVGLPGGLPLICNPVYSWLSPPSCLSVTNISAEWAKSVCKSSDVSTCPVQGRLSSAVFNQLDQSTKIVHTLIDDGPLLLNLQNCQFVRHVFTTIRERHCDPLRKYLEWQYVGLALISGGLMFAIILWVLYRRRRKHVLFHHSASDPESDRSIQKVRPQEAL